MPTQRLRLLPVALLGLTTLLLAGCGGPNLFDRLNNPWGYGCCGLIVLVLDVIAIIEVVGSSRGLGGKVLWILIILFFPILGCVLYYLFGR